MPAAKQSTDKKAIRKLDMAWGKAATRKDLKAVASFYARDGSVVWPGGPAIHGSAKVRTAWKSDVMTIPGLSLRFTPQRIDVAKSGDMAIDFGKVHFGHDDEKTGRPVTDIGKYVVVWKKVNGAWKVLYDCYNLNK